MKKKRYITLALMLSLLSINKTYASCTQELLNEFNQIKNQYKIITTYNNETQTYNMRIETAGNNKFGYVFTIDHEYSCNKVSNTVTECTGLKPGSQFYARVIGRTNECNDLLKEEEIKLIKNNEYYGDPLCEGIEEFVLCQEMYDKDIDRESFESRIEIYKESKQEKIEEEKKEQQIEKEQQNIINKTKNYIKENLVQVIIVTVFIILVIITLIITIISAKKSRRLE